MTSEKNDRIHELVRNRYAAIAQANRPCCSSTCCSPTSLPDNDPSARLGYTEDELATVPDGANLGLGCGNPQLIARLQPGETVLDLGSGAGFDCFLAARQVGDSGRVIGVDMTPEMVGKARANARKAGCTNVEFRLGEIEHLPVADNSVEVIISNCVINLSPAKKEVFGEAYRVLCTRGRLAISDVVAISHIPEKVRQNMDAHCGCIAGAVQAGDLEQLLRDAGFSEISIQVNEESRKFIRDWFPGSGLEKYVRSAIITATK